MSLPLIAHPKSPTTTRGSPLSPPCVEIVVERQTSRDVTQQMPHELVLEHLATPGVAVEHGVGTATIAVLQEGSVGSWASVE